MRYGSKTAPAWIEPYRIAQSLFTQPWKMIGGTKTLWYARAQAVRDAEVYAANAQRAQSSSLDEIDARQRRKR